MKRAAFRSIDRANAEIDRLRQQRTDIVDQWEVHAATQDAEIKRLRAALEAAQALETFYISRAWAMYEDEASLWAAFAEARRAALEATR